MNSARRSDWDILRILLNKGKSGKSVLMEAVWFGRGKAVKKLIRAGANANEQDPSGMTALIVAAMNGDRFIVKQLIAGGAEVNGHNASGWTALMASYTFRKQAA